MPFDHLKRLYREDLLDEGYGVMRGGGIGGRGGMARGGLGASRGGLSRGGLGRGGLGQAGTQAGSGTGTSSWQDSGYSDLSSAYSQDRGSPAEGGGDIEALSEKIAEEVAASFGYLGGLDEDEDYGIVDEEALTELIETHTYRGHRIVGGRGKGWTVQPYGKRFAMLTQAIDWIDAHIEGAKEGFGAGETGWGHGYSRFSTRRMTWDPKTGRAVPVGEAGYGAEGVTALTPCGSWAEQGKPPSAFVEYMKIGAGVMLGVVAASWGVHLIRTAFAGR